MIKNRAQLLEKLSEVCILVILYKDIDIATTLRLRDMMKNHLGLGYFLWCRALHNIVWYFLMCREHCTKYYPS